MNSFNYNQEIYIFTNLKKAMFYDYHYIIDARIIDIREKSITLLAKKRDKKGTVYAYFPINAFVRVYLNENYKKYMRTHGFIYDDSNFYRFAHWLDFNKYQYKFIALSKVFRQINPTSDDLMYKPTYY